MSPVVAEAILTLQHGGASADALRVAQAIFSVLDPTGSAALTQADLVRLSGLSPGRCYIAVGEILDAGIFVTEKRQGRRVYRMAGHDG